MAGNSHLDLAREIQLARDRLRELEDAGRLDPGDAQRRGDYLTGLELQYREATRLCEPRVFLSYAVDNIRNLHTESYRQIHDTRCSEHGVKFQVEVGFRQDGEPDVLDHVRAHMRRCCLFVGLLTADFALGPSDPPLFAPSGWVILEAGMAQGMRIPCVLLVEKGVHPDFWKKQLGHWRHVEFEQGQFKTALGRVSRLLQEHYDHLRRSSQSI